MALYKYTGFDAHGEPVAGEIEALTTREAILALRGSGYEISSITQADREKPPATRKPLTWNDLHQLNAQMLMIAKGGLPLAPSIEQMSRDVRNPRLKGVLDDIRRDLEVGRTMDEAFARHPESFSPVYLATIKAGEATGNLPQIFLRLTEYSKNILEVRSSLRAAMTYPAIVCFMSMAIVFFLLVKVVPVFAEIFHEFGGGLPAPTRLLVNAGDFLQYHAGAVIGGVVAVIFLGVLLRIAGRRSVAVAAMLDWVFTHIPLLGRLFVRAAIVRFCGTLRLLLEANAPMTECLGLAAAASGNAQLADRVGRAARDVARGIPLAEALANTHHFDNGFCWLIENAERQGTLCSALQILEEDYARNLKQTQSIVVGIIEPAIITVVGIMIGFIVTAMYLPVFTLGDALH